MTMSSAKAPPLPKTPPADETVEVGELTVSEMRMIDQLRAAADQVIREIGNMEVRKSHLLARLDQLETQGQAILAGAAKRLNIPDGEAWHLAPDGKVRQGSGTSI